jgi:hypothetical protein
VEPDDPVQPRADGGESVHLHPNLDLSDRADETPEGYDDLEDAEADVEALEAAEEEVGPAVEAPVLAETEAELAEDEPAAADTPDEE